MINNRLKLAISIRGHKIRNQHGLDQGDAHDGPHLMNAVYHESRLTWLHTNILHRILKQLRLKLKGLHCTCTSESTFFLTTTHFEALMLALFNKLRALQFGLFELFPIVVTCPSCEFGGLWRVVRAIDAALRLSEPLWSAASSKAAQILSLH